MDGSSRCCCCHPTQSVCGRPGCSNRIKPGAGIRCEKCRHVWWCSAACQSQHTSGHINHCKPNTFMWPKRNIATPWGMGVLMGASNLSLAVSSLNATPKLGGKGWPKPGKQSNARATQPSPFGSPPARKTVTSTSSLKGDTTPVIAANTPKPPQPQQQQSTIVTSAYVIVPRARAPPIRMYLSSHKLRVYMGLETDAPVHYDLSTIVPVNDWKTASAVKQPLPPVDVMSLLTSKRKPSALITGPVDGNRRLAQSSRKLSSLHAVATGIVHSQSTSALLGNSKGDGEHEGKRGLFASAFSKATSMFRSLSPSKRTTPSTPTHNDTVQPSLMSSPSVMVSVRESKQE